MKVTQEEMELLRVILSDYEKDGLAEPWGSAIMLMREWRKRGVQLSEFKLKRPLAEDTVCQER